MAAVRGDRTRRLGALAAKLTNDTCWRQARRYLVGGVNSPVRSFRAVGGRPFFVDRGEGATLWDVEGNRYLDYVCSWGALILGHRPPEVSKAVEEALERGTTFGIPTPGEAALAKEIAGAVPSMEQIRFVSSGTEAVMSAVRLARAATGRTKILKFDGAYHGHLDALLTKAGSGMATLGLPSSPGVPRQITRDTITVPFNDLKAVQETIRRHRGKIACLLLEPILANVGVVLPKDGFLNKLRQLTKENRILLIFDEVITGFRVGYGGAQERFGVEPDITVLGKVIGGGFPIGAYGASRRLMRLVAPEGPVYQAGTLAGHPVAMAAGLATLRVLQRPKIYFQLEETGTQLRRELTRLSAKAGVPVVANQIGGLFSLFFRSSAVLNGSHARSSNAGRYARYFHGMLSRGIYLPPSAFEAWFISTAHGDRQLEETLKSHASTLKEL